MFVKQFIVFDDGQKGKQSSIEKGSIHFYFFPPQHFGKEEKTCLKIGTISKFQHFILNKNTKVAHKFDYILHFVRAKIKCI